jgi:hypothetical protein
MANRHGFHDLDRCRFAILGEPYRATIRMRVSHLDCRAAEPCGEEISAVELPCIAGFNREQDQLTNRDDASVMVGGPLLDVAHLVGQPNATAFHDLLDFRSPPRRAGFAMDLFTQLLGGLLAFV